MATKDCVFCRIARGDSDTNVLYKDNRVYVVKDIKPRAPTHLLIIPLQHMASLAYVGERQEAMLGHMYMVAEEMARREGVTISGYRLVVNQGPDSGQEIAHIHMHLLAGKKLTMMG